VEVTGGNAVSGAIRVAGLKTASVPIIAASLLAEGDVEIVNLPDIEDIRVLLSLVRHIGGVVEQHGNVTSIRTASMRPGVPLPAEVVQAVHGTIYLMPVLLGRFGEVRIASTFGGCQIGERPVEHILTVLRAAGAAVEVTNDSITAKAGTLNSVRLSADFSKEWDKYRSGMTKAALLIGACAPGETVITDAYTRASITELSDFLRAIGAEVAGDGSPRVVVKGGNLRGGKYEISGDYLEALTYFALAAVCKGEVEVTGVDPSHCSEEIRWLREVGVDLEQTRTGMRAVCDRRLRGVSFDTSYIDTDIQPVFASVMVISEGTSVIEERVWERRFQYAEELARMGAKVKVSGSRLFIEGVPELFPARVHAADLRAAAALLIAAAAARGTSRVSGLGHLRRGYEDLVTSMRRLGVAISDQ
jgi:UDP-N-acetylglucosamine 1-carboxyvinyltransferase